MANNNVRFIKVTLQETYEALSIKDPKVLYWIDETQRLYCGEKLYGTGLNATTSVAGLLSPEDKAKLDALVTGGISGLSAVDGTIKITDAEDGSKLIGVAIADLDGNALKAVSGGLFVPTVDLTNVENKLIAVENSVLQLKEDVAGGIRYKGAVATIDELPTDAKQGDLYEVTDDGSEWCYNGEKWFEYGSAHFTPVAGDGIQINGNEIAIKIADNAHGLVTVDGTLALSLATAENDGAMSKEDKAFIDSIPYAYVVKKYEITDAPEGTLVNYYEKEIRIMCPENAEYHLQSVGAGGDANSYYVTLKTYAPNGAVGYIEHLGGKVDSEILNDIKIDSHSRRYQPTWLAVAKYDAESGAWSYYGDNSTANKYIGWDYQIDWYSADGVIIDSDSIRINLSNKDCHFTSEPYYMAGYAESSEVEELKATIAAMEDIYTWGEM